MSGHFSFFFFYCLTSSHFQFSLTFHANWNSIDFASLRRPAFYSSLFFDMDSYHSGPPVVVWMSNVSHRFRNLNSWFTVGGAVRGGSTALRKEVRHWEVRHWGRDYSQLFAWCLWLKVWALSFLLQKLFAMPPLLLWTVPLDSLAQINFLPPWVALGHGISLQRQERSLLHFSALLGSVSWVLGCPSRLFFLILLELLIK